MPVYDLNEAQIHAIAPSTFARGEGYFHDGAVLHVTERGDHYFGAVQGSDDEPYQVQVHLSDEGIEAWTCSCPNEWDGACKHVVAVLLMVLHADDEIDVRPPLDTLLPDLDAPQLRRLVLDLVAQEPALADVVEQAIRTPLRGTRKRCTAP